VRKLLILRGLPGSGKSTWIKKNDLSGFTLSSDAFRLLLRSPELSSDGEYYTHQSSKQETWAMLRQALEYRMKSGELTVVDATHIKENDLIAYKDLIDAHRYEACLVDFTQISLTEVLAQNAERKSTPGFVPEAAILEMNNQLTRARIPKWLRVIKPDEVSQFLSLPVVDLNAWKKIHHIGDLQSCYTPLKKLLRDGMNADEFYIFAGDFLDRGTEHAEIADFILRIMDLPNVVFIEGNHEAHLWKWCNDVVANSSEFTDVTQPALEAAQVDKRTVKRLCQKLKEVFLYRYLDKTVLVTHGGLPFIPDAKDLTKIAAATYIKGAGYYNDDIDEEFNDNPKLQNGQYQVHGHRNNQGNPIRNGRSWNLEGKVEHGGYLRAVTLDHNGWTPVEILNDLGPKVSDTNMNIVERLQTSRFINERRDGFGISSFNFSRAAFYDGIWNAQVVKARGLFLRVSTGEVVARSYDKFFNVNELSLTSMASLEHNLKFPVKVYVKENGFLGIIGYDNVRDELIIASKASTANEYAGYFKAILTAQCDLAEIKKIVQTGLSLVFEVIDPANDPHIISYKEPHVVLLDSIKNTVNFEKMNDETSERHASQIGCTFKKLHLVLNDWNEFKAWHETVTAAGYKLHGNEDVEGFVIEDGRQFMTKIKLDYYSFWKSMRSAKDRYKSGKPMPDYIANNPRAADFLAWLKTKDRAWVDQDIIKLREAYFTETAETA
jgi:predicted kinase